MGYTSIEWTSTVNHDGSTTKGMSWNPITGCSKTSPGCDNCYAERMSKRLRGRCGYDREDPFQVTFHRERLNDPYRWVKPKKVFVCSMGDLFHEDVEEWMLNEVFERMMSRHTQHITFIILTKRPERMQEYISSRYLGYPYRNIWVGVTCENQDQADKRILYLLNTPVAVRFVSIEPMLGLIDLTTIKGRKGKSFYLDVLSGDEYGVKGRKAIPKLDWVIAGGETGPGARYLHENWLMDMVYQCRKNNTPFFFKRVSGRNSNNRHYPTPDSAKIRMFPGDIWL